MKKALVGIEEGIIWQVCDQEFPVAEPLYWVDCSDDITSKHRYENGIFKLSQDEIRTHEELWGEFRAERNAMLKMSDWTQLPDSNPPGGKQAWADYRQALRDLPLETQDPSQPVWPETPSS